MDNKWGHDETARSSGDLILEKNAENLMERQAIRRMNTHTPLLIEVAHRQLSFL